MTDPKQALYDILGEAYKAGELAAALNPNAPSAASVLFPLAARMEQITGTLINAETQRCAAAAAKWQHTRESRVISGATPRWIKEEILARSLPSSPERET